MTYDGLVGFAGDGADTLAVVIIGIDVSVVAGGGRLTGNLSSEEGNEAKREREDVHDSRRGERARWSSEKETGKWKDWLSMRDIFLQHSRTLLYEGKGLGELLETGLSTTLEVEDQRGGCTPLEWRYEKNLRVVCERFFFFFC